MPDLVTLLTDQVTLETRERDKFLLTVHWPLEFVVQLVLPLAPLLHEPWTVAPETGFSLES